MLWLDADVIEYPANIIEQLTALNRDIVHPNCVCEYGKVSFDLNAWTDGGRKHLSDLRGQGIVRLQSVGGTMLLDPRRSPPRRSGVPAFLLRRTQPLGARSASSTREPCGRDRDRRIGDHGKGHGDRVLGASGPGNPAFPRVSYRSARKIARAAYTQSSKNHLKRASTH